MPTHYNGRFICINRQRLYTTIDISSFFGSPSLPFSLSLSLIAGEREGEEKEREHNYLQLFTRTGLKRKDNG